MMKKMKVAQEGPMYTHNNFTLLEQYLHACKCNAHKPACKFLYLTITVELYKIGSDEENESCSGGSDVYSQSCV